MTPEFYKDKKKRTRIIPEAQTTLGDYKEPSMQIFKLNDDDIRKRVAALDKALDKQSPDLARGIDDAIQGRPSGTEPMYVLTSKGVGPISARNKKIIALIKDGKNTPSQIAEALGLKLSTAKVELRILVHEGYISGEINGT